MAAKMTVTLSIPALEAEHRQYEEKIRRLKTQIDELQAKSNNVSNVLSYVREHLVIDENTSESEDVSDSPQTRKHIDDFIAVHQVFSTTGLVNAITNISPSAKVNSIQGELSRAVKRGDVRRIGRGIYTSLRFGESTKRYPLVPDEARQVPVSESSKSYFEEFGPEEANEDADDDNVDYQAGSDDDAFILPPGVAKGKDHFVNHFPPALAPVDEDDFQDPFGE